MPGILALDLTVAVATPRPDILGVLHHIRPSWDPECVVIKELQGGEVNCLWRCSLPEYRDHTDVVLIRVYGAGTEGYIDRERELLAMRIAHHAGMATPVYARFTNGLAYKYHGGDTLGEQTASTEVVERLMARKLAGIHLIDYRQCLVTIGEEKQIERVSRPRKISEPLEFIMSKMTDYQDPTKEEIRKQEFPNKQDALAEVHRMEKEFYEMCPSTCFCHCDPNPHNIIYDQENGTVNLVDWEFAGVDYPQHDLAIYLIGKCMLNDFHEDSLKLYPDKVHQSRWIRWYLEYRAELSGDEPKSVTSQEVDYLYTSSILFGCFWSQVVVYFFLLRDQESPDAKQSFRKALHFQRLFVIMKKELK